MWTHTWEKYRTDITPCVRKGVKKNLQTRNEACKCEAVKISQGGRSLESVCVCVCAHLDVYDQMRKLCV